MPPNSSAFRVLSSCCVTTYAHTAAMPPRRSARVAAVAERESSALAPLPHGVVLDIFARLPSDARARAKLVSRGWNCTLSDVSLWTRLDLSLSSGVRVAVTDAVLRGASGFARGSLTTLDVSCCGAVTHEALRAVVADNAHTLAELRACHEHPNRPWGLLTTGNVETILNARVLDADVYCEEQDWALMLRMMRCEPPFGPVRVHHLRVNCEAFAVAELQNALIAVCTHEWLSSFALYGAQLEDPTALDTVVDAALLRHVRALSLHNCGLTPACAPALARLLGGEALTELLVKNEMYGRQLLDAPAAALLANALRANSTLTTLSLGAVRLWHDAAAAVALLGALTGHPSLRTLDIRGHNVGAPTAAAGAALGALVAANAPALRELDISYCSLGDDGLGPLVDALPANTHLRTLNISGSNTSEAFGRDRLLPAVRANSSLRQLSAGYGPAARDVTALVAARGS
jgi:hypothetical protein